MLYQLPDSDIERFIQEDMPYGDLTTLLLGIGACFPAAYRFLRRA